MNIVVQYLVNFKVFLEEYTQGEWTQNLASNLNILTE